MCNSTSDRQKKSYSVLLVNFLFAPVLVLHNMNSLLRRGLFVLWGGFCVVGRLGRKKKRARGARPIVPRALSIFFDY